MRQVIPHGKRSNLCCVLGSLLLLLLAACVEVRNLESDLYSLVESERAFSRLSRTTGMRDAFMTFLADEAIVFRPHPVLGKPIYAKSTNHPNRLIWRPVFADVSYGGDLGYTTGPYEYRDIGSDQIPSGYGHYVSIWKKLENGNWRVIFDAGIQYDGPDTTAGKLTFAETRKQVSQAKSQKDRASECRLFYDNENAFNRILMDFGYFEAAQKYYSPQIRYYRNGAFPIRGRTRILNKFADLPVQALALPDTAIMASSCDLGLTYGLFQTFEGTNTEDDWSQYSYLRIWKKENGHLWRIVLDLALPVSTGLTPPPDLKARFMSGQ